MCVRGAACLVCAGMVFGGAACRREERPPERAAASSIRTDRYVIRGVVAALPSADRPGSELQVRHEAMPHFVGQGGQLGMDTMTMPFPLDPRVSLAGIAVGDKVEVSFEVDVDPSTQNLMGYRATAIARLPAETELDFSPLKR